MKTFFRRTAPTLLFLIAAVAAFAVSRAQAMTPTAPVNYVSPQERIVAASTAPAVASIDPKHAAFKLPAGMHPNSIAAQSLRAKYDAEEGAGCVLHKACVPATGRTADGKYPVYALEGGLEDLSYVSPRANTVYKPDDLLRRLVFLGESDTKGGQYQCEFVCKDRAGHIVGLNPQLKWMLNPPAAGKRK